MTPRHHRTEEAPSAASSTGSGRGATPTRRRRRERRRGSAGKRWRRAGPRSCASRHRRSSWIGSTPRRTSHASDGDGQCVATAFREGRAAVRALVAFDGDRTMRRWLRSIRPHVRALVAFDGAEVSLQTLPRLPTRRSAPRSRPRRTALCAQHVALGASHSNEDWHNIFQRDSDAFETVRADGVERRAARARGRGLAELWYCLASAEVAAAPRPRVLRR